MTTPAATIVVPTRGGSRRLPVLLRSLEAQDTDDFEVIVVVDGDIDGTADLVAEWAQRLPVRSLVFPENRGRAAALNAGADSARGDLLIRSDDDLEPGPGLVSGHLARHRNATEPIGVVGLTTNQYPDSPFARAYGRAADRRFLDDALGLPADRTWRLWAANVSVQAQVHARLGGYDARYRRYGWEDVDFGYRLRQAGIPVLVAPEVMAVHHGASTTTAVRALRALHSGAARETFVEIHGDLALPDAPGGRGLWDRLVGAGAAVATERTLRAYGPAVDAAARVLPPRIAEKLVALGVESAGLAGVRYPDRARSRF
ncbi:glycosyltransferase family A protein [Sinomonas sp. ASV486]|uniref:glycosyltransferase family 2 protein n=1 Tax=Sinomonas sp. ASV486 TaxID=3051170 RepID=UPI0027DB6B5C|nr:glycosyltransferase family A protein [Sinomonas sp. ASV486]MDQ4488844.1 glycosyltransferase family A protein [Sinomonas sp. ASV486]